MTPLRLLCVLAHPDDETLGCGGVLAKHAAEGVETFLITAARGEKGRIGTERPGPAVVGPVREAELRRAVGVLGIPELHLLGYMDGARWRWRRCSPGRRRSVARSRASPPSPNETPGFSSAGRPRWRPWARS